MSAVLSNIKVLDLSRVLAGPYAGQILGDLGADVVKVERPGMGDETRGWPPYLPDEHGTPTSESAYYLTANRNKKSVTIDFSKPEGQALVRKLADESDVVIENFKVGSLWQYGLDYESLSATNPRLVYCSITGFGQAGPYANRTGYDFLVQAMGGLMSVTGPADDEPGSGPTKAGVALTDVMTGLYAAIAILAALFKREETKRGQHIDLALMDVQVSGLANQAMNFLTTGKIPKRFGNAHPSIVPYQNLPASDGAVAVAVGNDDQFGRMCDVLGHSEWKHDERFKTNPARVANRDALVRLLSEVMVKRDAKTWTLLLQESGVPCGPINDVSQVFQDPQVQARGLRIEMPHPLSAKVSLVASPLRFSDTPVEYRLPPPLLGEHTEEILKKRLQLSREEIERLRKLKVI